MRVMTADCVVIAPLDPSSSLPTTIANTQFALWGPLTGHQSVRAYEGFLRRSVSSALPTVLVAKRNGEFVGSVNLLEYELPTRRALSPWMGQLFVIAEERSRGLGRALVGAAVKHAVALGYRRVHLFTSGTLPQFYISLGWKPMETIDYLGKSRTIMAFDA